MKLQDKTKAHRKGSFWVVFSREAALFNKHPLLWGSLLLISLVPAIYTGLYVESIWDPYGNLSHLPVGLVIADKGTDFKGSHYNLGETLGDELKKKEVFSFVSYPTEVAGKAAVQKGDVFFALVVPPDFSAKAVPGEKPSELILLSSEGTNAISALIATKVGQKVVGNVNAQLELARWKKVIAIEDRVQNAVGVVEAIPRELMHVGETLKDGAQKGVESRSLTHGIEKIADGLAEFDSGDSSPKMTATSMAASVKLNQVELAPILSNGAGFLPYFMGFSLWIGAISASFLLRLRVFSRDLQPANAWIKVAGKWMIPILFSISAAMTLGLAVQFVMKIPYSNAGGIYVTLFFAAITYSCIILGVNTILGEAGKIISVLLLALQLSVAAGVYPITLSGTFFQILSPWLPLTHVVAALRAALFGAFDGNWAGWLPPLALWVLGAYGLSVLFSHFFKYVEDSDYGPALDLPRRK